jgi:hypothetical protein
MGLLKQLMIFGKTGLQGLPTTGDSFSPGLLADKGLLGSPYSQHWILWQARGESQYLETFRAGATVCMKIGVSGANPSSPL